MTHDERIQKLAEALALLDEVRVSLNNKSITCECCGLKRHENWMERGCRDMINGAKTRIERVSRTLSHYEGRPIGKPVEGVDTGQ